MQRIEAIRRAALATIGGFALLVAAAAPARAQSGRLLAAGAGLSATKMNDGAWDRAPDYFIFRLPRPERLGISWNIGSDSFPVPETATPSRAVGSLRVHHFLFGPGYTWRAGALELTASGLVGPSTNRFSLDEDSAPNAPTLSSRWSWSEMADVTVWIDLGRWFGLKVSADYMFDRPTLVFETGGAETSWKARRIHTQVGLVFGFY
jgi:hypothetical protein